MPLDILFTLCSYRVDAEGAMLGLDVVLVRRTPQGYRSLGRGEASALQKSLHGFDRGEDWLFDQCGRIAASLDRGELALAQIYGLRIPTDDLEDRHRFAKAGFDPSQPRVPKGDPDGGQWVDAGAVNVAGAAGGGDDAPPPPDNPPIKWEMKPLDPATSGTRPASGSMNNAAVLGPPGIDAINPDYSIENLPFGVGGGGGFVLSNASRALARTLALTGFRRAVGFEAHHIVPVRALAAAPARAALERFGINVNDAVNGVFLSEEQHSGLHTIKYYVSLNRALSGASTKAEAEQTLQAIAEALKNGTFPP